MKIVKQVKEYKIETNGTTFFVSNGQDCVGRFNTERKAINYFDKVLYLAGIEA
jgi:hypothetical protein